MPRPRFTPTEQQRRALEAIRKAARERERRRAQVDEPLDKAIADAAAKKVPVSTIAEVLGWTRDTVYRHLEAGKD